MSDAAIASIVSAAVTVLTMIGGLVALWLKLKYKVEGESNRLDRKLDTNTYITEQAARSVESNSKVVATSVTAVDQINKKLNGGIDAAIAQAIEPIHKMLNEHTKKISELDDYVHQRNHDMLSNLQILSNKLDTITVLVKSEKK